jgi:hypothetical protein
MAILNNVISNETQKFSIGNYSFICEPYGILTLEKLYSHSKINSTCQDKIKNFYKKHPNLRYFSDSILHIRQMYHVEFKTTECVVYARGQKTLSEILLEEGLALREELFNDEEFNYLFLKAQKRAKFNKKGVWEEDILSECINLLYEDES